MSDIRKTWSVVEVGPHLQSSTNPRHSFEVMRVTDHEEAVDAVVDGAAAAIKEWREKYEALAAEYDRVCSEVA
jgi:hypothetical protein